MTKFMSLCDLRNRGGAESGIKLTGNDPRLWGSKRVEEQAPPDPYRAVYSGIGIVLTLGDCPQGYTVYTRI